MARLQLLLVDSDPRSLRVAGAGLSRHGFNVTPASGPEEALSRMRLQPADVVACAGSLGDGLAALRGALKVDPAFSAIPFVVLADAGGWTPAGGWAALGVADVVERPVVTGDLVARLRAAAEASSRNADFQSSLDRVSVVDLLEHFRVGQRSGTVTFSGRREGRLAFRDGTPLDATLGLHSGREAFFRMLACTDGDFDVRLGTAPSHGNLEGEGRALLEEGLAWVEAWDAALEQVPPLTAVLEQDAVKVSSRQGALPEEAGWILRLVDGERTIEDLVEASTLGGVSVLEILARLYFEGLVSVRKTTAPAGRRPRVEEWLNTPPVITPPEAPASRGPATVTLSREELSALESPVAEAAPATPPPGGALASGAEALEMPAAAEAAPATGSSTVSLSPEELAALEMPVAAPAAPATGPSTVSLSPEELAALEMPVAAPAAPATSPTTVSLSREEMAALGIPVAAEAAPGPVASAASLSDEELAALQMPVAGSAPAPEETVLPSGFMDEGGFPMGVPLSAPVRRTEAHGAVQSAPVAAPSPEVPARWMPFERAGTQAPAAVPAEPAPAPAPTAAEAPLPVVPEVAPPPAAEAPPATPEPTPEVPVTAAPVPSVAPEPHVDDHDDEQLAAMMRSSRSRWVLGGLAAAGLALVGGVAYVGLRPSPAPQQVAPTPVAAPAPVAEAPVPTEAADAGAEAQVAAGEAPAAAGGDAGEVDPLLVARLTGEPPAGPAPVAEPAKPVPAAAPAVAVPGAAAPVQQPAAAASAVPPPARPAAAPAPQAPSPAIAAPARAPAPLPVARPVDLSAVKPPPPQAPTAQDRVAPGLLPRKAVTAAPAADPNAAGKPSPAAAMHVYGAKQAMQHGLWKLAAESYRKAIALGAATPDVKTGLGICLVSSDPGVRGYQEAVEMLKQGLAQDEGNSRAWLSLGMAHQFLGNNPEAVTAYKRYLALAPSGKSAAEVRAMLERL